MSLESRIFTEVHETRKTVVELDTTIRGRGGVLDRLDQVEKSGEEDRQASVEIRAQVRTGLYLVGAFTGLCSFLGPKIIGAIWGAIVGN